MDDFLQGQKLPKQAIFLLVNMSRTMKETLMNDFYKATVAEKETTPGSLTYEDVSETTFYC